MNKLTRLPTVDRTAPTPARARGRVQRQHTRYFAFLSYSHKDRELADWLHAELERFRVPRNLAGQLTDNGIIPKRLMPVFRDQHELAAADDLGEEIQEALANSRFLIVLCSPDAAKSRWTNAEIDTFKRTRPDGCVLAAIAAGEPFASETAGNRANECFPLALRQKYDRRGRPTGKRAEPLAADLRGSEDDRRTGLMKLIAGMLGVGLDDLMQREATRRQRRLAMLAAASIAGMAVTSTLAITAIQARDAARDQRREAEGLVAFMVGDLKDKLEPIGKLDALDGVGSRVLAYYRNQDTSELSDDALVQRSRALNLMAEVAFNRGNLKEADQLYRQASAGTAEAVRRSPDDPQRIFDHAQDVFYVGEVARFGGRPAEAEAAWREYKRLADQMVALAPDNLKFRMEVLYANEDLGISLYNQHRFVEADRLFEGALGPMQNLASLYPENTTYRKEFATLLAWAADAKRARGNLGAAIATRERQVSALNQLVLTEADSDARSRLIIAHEGLGLALADSGQSQRAIQELQLAVQGAGDLIPIEPRNARWKGVAADARLGLATLLLSLGQRAEAAPQAAVGCEMVASLPSAYAATRMRLETTCAMLRARLALAAGASQAGISSAEQALASAQREHSEDPTTDRSRVGWMYLILGDARQKSGDTAGAAAAWNAGAAQMPTNVAERPLEMRTRLELLRRLGRANEAAALASRLDAIGYRSLI